jgi:hypothetical protein
MSKATNRKHKELIIMDPSRCRKSLQVVCCATISSSELLARSVERVHHCGTLFEIGLFLASQQTFLIERYRKHIKRREAGPFSRLNKSASASISVLKVSKRELDTTVSSFIPTTTSFQQQTNNHCVIILQHIKIITYKKAILPCSPPRPLE